MKICIFGASSASIDSSYIVAVEALAEKMARRGHSLVFGAGATGVMGAAARGVKRGGGYIRGVIPDFFKEECIEKIYTECDLLTYTENMSQRKSLMEDLADAFIIAPGGIGTLEEFYEVLTLKQLGRHNKAVAIYNLNGYYDNLEKFMIEMADKKFLSHECRQMYKYFTDDEQLLDYLENYSREDVDVRFLKRAEE